MSSRSTEHHVYHSRGDTYPGRPGLRWPTFDPILVYV